MSQFTLHVEFDGTDGPTIAALACSLAVDVLRQSGLTVNDASFTDAEAVVYDDETDLTPCEVDG